MWGAAYEISQVTGYKSVDNITKKNIQVFLFISLRERNKKNKDKGCVQ